MATSRAFCTLTLSVHSSQPPTPKATGWSNTTGSSGPGSILAAHGGVRDLPNTMGAHQVAQRFKKKKKGSSSPWTGEPGGLQSTGSQDSDMTERQTVLGPRCVCVEGGRGILMSHTGVLWSNCTAVPEEFKGNQVNESA